MKLFPLSTLIFLLLLLNAPLASACCPGDPYSPTELIMSQRDQRDILIIRLDPNTPLDNRQPPIYADVIQVIKGKPKSQRIVLHENYHFRNGVDFLLVCNSPDGINYHFDPCDQYTRSLDKLDRVSPGNMMNLFKEYNQLVKTKYTGQVNLKGSKNVLARGKMKNGKPEGSWTHYFLQSGKNKGTRIKSVTPYENGKPHGKESIYGPYKNYPLSAEYFYDHGKIEKTNYYQSHTGQSFLISSRHFIQQDGQNITKTFTIQTNGKKLEEVSEIKPPHSISSGHWRINKIKHGLYKDYYSNGQLKSMGKYFWGAQVGSWGYYKHNGETEKLEHYPTPYRPKNLFTVFHPNGQKKLQGKIHKDQLEKGWEKYNTAGTVIAYANFKNNKIEGTVENFFHNGTTLHYSQKYTNGEKNGPMVLYHKNEKTIAKKGQFIAGKPDGEFLEYFNDGALKSKKQYVNGVYHGTNESYYNTGILRMKSNHKEGLLHGEYLRNKKDGSTLNVVQYFENKVIDESKKTISN